MGPDAGATEGKESLMSSILQLYKCELCGKIVMVFHEGGGGLVCCHAPMKQMVENTTDAAKEKHVPVIEKTDAGYKVKVGSIPHPMEEKHYIEWVELLTDDTLYCKFLKPETAPEASFVVPDKPLMAREYCNLHGYWKGEAV